MQDNFRGNKFYEEKAKHTRKDNEFNKDILSELKINPVKKKIQNYSNK